MKKAFASLFAIMVAFSACNWDLSDDDNDLTGAAVTYTTETADSVEKISCFHDGILHSYEVRYISDTAARTVDQTQSYSSTGVLSCAWKYGRNAAGLVEVAACFGSDQALKFYDVYSYDTGGNVTTQAEYDGSGTLQWIRRYSVKSSGTASGELETAASFNGSVALDGGLQYYFIDTAAYPSKTWNMEVAYGTASGSLSGGVKASNPKACAATLTSLAAESRIDLSLPTVSAIADPAIPADFAVAGLAVSGYRFSFDDSHGNTTVALDKSWYPVSGIRDDSRLGSKITVNLTHDGQNRITGKSTYYGSTLALKVDIAYEESAGVASCFPVRIETSGSSMLMPLDYDISYGSAHHEVIGISVSSKGALVRKFEYVYSTPVTVSLTASAVRGMDPFAFMSDILKAGVVISEYDGDGKLIETFTSETSVDGVVVTVKRPNADGTAGGDVNGTYSIGYDSGGNCVSLVAKGSDGSVSWEEDLANFNDMWSSLESAASAIFDETMSYGSMVESMIPKKEAETVSKIQENFVYSLMF